MKFDKYLLPALLLALIVASSSCRSNRDAKAVVTVLRDTLNIVSGDSEQVPAVQAIVRFYQDEIGAEHIDTNIFTDTQGKAEFVWFEDAIIKCDVTYGLFQELETLVFLEQGETEEITVLVED